jgi:hypothetical protein
LHAQLTGRFLDCRGWHLLDAVDDCEAKRSAAAIEAAEQKDGRGLGDHGSRVLGDSGGALLRFEPDPTDLSDSSGIEEKDRAAVVGEVDE